MSNRIVPPSSKRGVWALPVRLAALTLVALALVLGLAPHASADPTPVTIANQNMEGALKLLPGDIIAVGYIFRVQKPHPAIEIRLSDPVLTVKYRCANESTIRRFYVTAVEGSVPVQPIAQDIEQWAPTKDLNLADGFQLSYKVEDACGGRALIVDSSTGGVDFSANVGSSQPDTKVELKFHYRVPRAKGLANVNCADQGVNPSPGLSACTGKWSSAVRVRASGIWTPTPTATRTPLPTSTPTITPVPTRTPVPTPTEVEGKPTIPPQVYGWVYADLDGDGVRDGLGGQVGAEPGIQGVLIQVLKLDTDEVVASQLSWTDQPPLSSVYYKGYFNINVPEGTFRVRQTLIAGYTLTTPNDVVVTVVEDYPGVVNFGNQPAP